MKPKPVPDLAIIRRRGWALAPTTQSHQLPALLFEALGDSVGGYIWKFFDSEQEAITALITAWNSLTPEQQQQTGFGERMRELIGDGQ